MSRSLLHSLPPEVATVASPERFTFPFAYTPHPLCLAAAEAVKTYVKTHNDVAQYVGEGKMMGVLVVNTAKEGEAEERAFLAAYSGTAPRSIAGLAYFVPNVVRLQALGEDYTKLDAEIQRLTQEIAALEKAEAWAQARHDLATLQAEATRSLKELSQTMPPLKAVRQAYRQQQAACATLVGTDYYEKLRQQADAMLQDESQYLKGELRRRRKAFEEEMSQLQQRVDSFAQTLAALQQQRTSISHQTQQIIFAHFPFLNARGEGRNLLELFPEMPPSGSGECCAPKLLQTAYENDWQPICMAEFWMGEAPDGELRQEGFFYPACRQKCWPILQYMLVGLDVDENPIPERNKRMAERMTIVYADKDLVVVNKPSGMLAVQGHDDVPTVQSEVKRLFPQARGPMICHRLDMDTQGLMVVALNTATYHALQAMFADGSIHKTYIALLTEPLVSSNARPLAAGLRGEIRLPLCPNPNDRPRQMVSAEYGWEAHTSFHVLRTEPQLLVELSPHTGRTHQLRVHCAHAEGLCRPILGDPLYGQPYGQLHLQASGLAFVHPTTQKELRFQLPYPAEWPSLD